MEIQHKILQFDETTGQIRVNYYNDEFPRGFDVMVGVMDPNTQTYLDQETIKERIDSFCPTEHFEVMSKIKAAQIPDHVLELKNSIPSMASDPEYDARFFRNQRLYESDWAVLPDNQLSDTARDAWLSYRQALRDLPTVEGWPTEIVWPVRPE